MEIPKFLKKEGEALVYNDTGTLKYYVPQLFFDRSFSTINGEYVDLFGLFNYSIDKPGTKSVLKAFNLPSMFRCKPTRIEKLKNVRLIKEQEPEDYQVLIFEKGAEAISSVRIPKDIINTEILWKLFFYARFPTTIPYDRIQDIIAENDKLNKIKYGLNVQLFGILIGELARSKNDPGVLFRSVYKDNMNDYKYIGIVDAPKYVSPYQSLTSQNWDDGVVGAIINDDPKGSPMEFLFTESEGPIVTYE